MRIGYFVEKIPYADQHYFQKQYPCGGSEFAAHDLAVNIAKRENKVDVFTTGIRFKTVVEVHENMTIHRCGTIFRTLNRNFSPMVLMKIRKCNFDIVHAHVCTEPFFPIFASLYAKRKDKPLVLTCHVDAGKFRDDTPYKYKIASKFHGNLIDKIYSVANVIITPSEQFAKESTLLRKYENKIVAIPNGINLKDFYVPYSKDECREKLGLPLDKNIILFVGNPHPNKGADVLIRTMQRIIKESPDVKLVFVGEGMLKERLKELSKKLNVDRHIKFTGFVSDMVKKMYYKSSDVFVLPSFFDTFGIVLLEASAFGLPLVVSNIEAFKDFIKDDYNGIVTEVGNEKDLAEKIIYLVKNEGIQKKIGRNAREKVEDYSWEKIANETEKLYEKVVNER